MKRTIICVLIMALALVFTVVFSFFYFSNYRTELTGETAEESPGVVREVEDERELTTPESQMIDVEEEYYNSVNADITLEQLKQLQESGMVSRISILQEGSPFAKAYVSIFDAEVVAISGRTITVSKGNAPPTSIYIGTNAIIAVLEVEELKQVEFSRLKTGDLVNITAFLQYGRNDPLVVMYFTIKKD